MRVRNQDFTAYTIEGLSEDDLRGIVKMIDGACLPERRQFQELKTEIKEVIEL
ncbi:MAG: hypothetical protein IJV38_08025 [Prevotella sp.]|nr:hypothetical protein [Prevotella sp.]